MNPLGKGKLGTSILAWVIIKQWRRPGYVSVLQWYLRKSNAWIFYDVISDGQYTGQPGTI